MDINKKEVYALGLRLDCMHERICSIVVLIIR